MIDIIAYDIQIASDILVSSMQLWFLAALLGMLFAGFSNFAFKIAASKKYDAETFNMYGGLTSIVFAGVGLFIVAPTGLETWTLIIITVFSGIIATCGGVMKVYALRYIDTTIFYPLFKLLSPLLAVIIGISLFSERFTLFEWFGIMLGLLVPLLLISKIENQRQNNLIQGVIFVVAISGTSAVAAALNKYAVDVGMSEWATLWYASWGIFIGSIILVAGKLKNQTFSHIYSNTKKDLVFFAFIRSFLICVSLLLILYAYGHGGTLGVVQTIHSMYIIIPILLSVWWYKEHIDTKKVAAVIISVVALGFLG